MGNQLLGSCLLGLGIMACATPSPQQTLKQYKSALENKDASKVAELSDSAFREIYDSKRLTAYLAENPEDAQSMADILGERPVATAIHASIELSSGHTVRMVWENGEWRVRSGGIPVGRSDSPKASLESFFRAFHDSRLDVVRALIPKTHASRYLDDEHLEAHMNSIRARVENAQNRMPADAIASEKGDMAEIPYGEGWRVSFVKEGNVWKITDLE